MSMTQQDPKTQAARGVTRREALRGLAAAGAAALLSPARPALAEAAAQSGVPIRFGIDNFSVRAMKWKAPRLIEYAAELKLDTLFLSDLDVYESFDPQYLRDLRAKAEAAGVAIHAGTGSVCPTSNSFNAKHGTAVEHLKMAIGVAKEVGSPVIRCVLGNGGDRNGDGGIEQHIEALLGVLKESRSAAIDAGVKVAIENHAGDMQSWELAELIDTAGRDFVGANMDSGNAAWTLEDPMTSLEILGPRAATCSLRDSAVWLDEGGVNVMWTNMGRGHVDWKAYVARFGELCPGIPFQIETISQTQPRKFPCFTDEFWKPFPKARARDFARFMDWARKGSPVAGPPPPESATPQEREQATQRRDLEESVKYCKESLGLGVKK